MESIRRHAFQAAARDCALAALAVLVLMFHNATDSFSALKVGAIGFTLVAVFMILKVDRTERTDVEGTEVWGSLKQDERPPRAVARRLIGRATRQACYTLGWYTSGVAVSLWAMAIGIGLTSL